MTDERLDEIRKLFWNYKYTAAYDEVIYQAAVELITYIDTLKKGTNADDN